MQKYNAAITLLAFIVFGASPFVGIASISYENIFDASSADALIFWEIRAPRTLLAFFTGGALALSGLLFQTLFRNPLMTPFTLGVSSGATLGAAIAIYIGLNASFFGFSLITLFAFAASIMTVVLLLAFSSKSAASGQNLLLLGVALSHLYTAVLLVVYYSGSALQAHSIIRFTLGNLGTTGFAELIPVALFAVLLLFAALYFAAELRLLGVCEENARLKGVDTKKVTLLLLLFVSLSVGSAVSIVGPIGFVGLVVPHLLKKLFLRPSYMLIFASFVGGGAFLLLCDILSRSVGFESEIPIGVVTAFLGAPFFIYLILSRGKK
jgi:iron complex transport system permease protein